MLNFKFGQFTVAPTEFAKHFFWFFLLIKKWFHKNLLFFILANVLLGVVVLHGCMGTLFGKEGGIQVLAGLVPSSQKVGSLLKKPWPAKPDRKVWQKEFRQIHFNWKMHLATFDIMILAFSWFGKIGCCLQTNSKNRKKYKESRIIFTKLLMIIYKIEVP